MCVFVCVCVRYGPQFQELRNAIPIPISIPELGIGIGITFSSYKGMGVEIGIEHFLQKGIGIGIGIDHQISKFHSIPFQFLSNSFSEI